MSAPRRPWKTVSDPVQVLLRVQQTSADRFTQMAARAGVSKSAFLEAVVEHTPLDANGVPVWWPEEYYPEIEEELPLTG